MFNGGSLSAIADLVPIAEVVVEARLQDVFRASAKSHRTCSVRIAIEKRVDDATAA
jgi:hypothetical protein